MRDYRVHVSRITFHVRLLGLRAHEGDTRRGASASLAGPHFNDAAQVVRHHRAHNVQPQVGIALGIESFRQSHAIIRHLDIDSGVPPMRSLPLYAPVGPPGVSVAYPCPDTYLAAL